MRERARETERSDDNAHATSPKNGKLITNVPIDAQSSVKSQDLPCGLRGTTSQIAGGINQLYNYKTSSFAWTWQQQEGHRSQILVLRRYRSAGQGPFLLLPGSDQLARRERQTARVIVGVCSTSAVAPYVGSGFRACQAPGL